MSKSRSGDAPEITQAMKNQKIHEAEAIINSEKEKWANTGKNGYLKKLEKSGMFGAQKPKELFFMLRMVSNELEIYIKGSSSGLVGEPKGKPKSSWKFCRGLSCTPVDDPKNPLGQFVLELEDRIQGKLQLGCGSEAEEWAAAFSAPLLDSRLPLRLLLN